jgi:predicted XRE-type DNA-binding protein
MTDKQRFASVWDALENTPQEAASMKARSALMMALAEVIHERGMTQGEAAALFGVTQPRVSDLVRGKINLFSLDTLIDMAATAGMAPMVKVSKPKAPAAKPALRRKRRAAVALVAA